MRKHIKEQLLDMLSTMKEVSMISEWFWTVAQLILCQFLLYVLAEIRIEAEEAGFKNRKLIDVYVEGLRW